MRVSLDNFKTNFISHNTQLRYEFKPRAPATFLIQNLQKPSYSSEEYFLYTNSMGTMKTI